MRLHTTDPIHGEYNGPACATSSEANRYEAFTSLEGRSLSTSSSSSSERATAAGQEQVPLARAAKAERQRAPIQLCCEPVRPVPARSEPRLVPPRDGSFARAVEERSRSTETGPHAREGLYRRFVVQPSLWLFRYQGRNL